VGRNGVGALVDINGTSMLICDSEDWFVKKFESKYVIDEPRLREALHATGFFRVPDEHDWDRVSAKYFTSWYYSPRTRALKRLGQWTEPLGLEDKNKFYSEGPFEKVNGRYERLYPMPQFLTCKHGHLTEFPYLDWCHKGNVCDNPRLEYTSAESMPFVRCINCKARNDLPNMIDRSELYNYLPACPGYMPWKQKGHDREQCGEPVIPLRKEDSNSYFPNFYTSLKLPFKIDVDISWQQDNLIPSINDAYQKDDQGTFDVLVGLLKNNHPQLKTEDVLDFLAEDEGGGGGIEDLQEFKRAEYNVLNQQVALHEDEFSKTEFQQRVLDTSEHNDSLFSIFDTISVLPRITTVKAAVDFSRDKPQDMGSKFTISLKRTDGKYIAVESRGEGIFFSFKTDWINERMDEFDDKFRFVHTMSHLIMKELGEVSGYPITSLSERLYVDDTPNQEMFGVLIYTASGDKNGTLGGVVEQGMLQNFITNLHHALSHAEWCSFDPVCSHQEMDPDTENIAACHYCSYVPETSCEEFNHFLDRNVVLQNL
jgi:hypothetical protein